MNNKHRGTLAVFLVVAVSCALVAQCSDYLPLAESVAAARADRLEAHIVCDVVCETGNRMDANCQNMCKAAADEEYEYESDYAFLTDFGGSAAEKCLTTCNDGLSACAQNAADSGEFQECRSNVV